MPVDVSDFAPNLVFPTVTIANGATVSGAIDLAGMTLCGVILPAALTGVAMTFQCAPDGFAGTYVAMADGAGSNISKTVAASKFVPLDPAQFRGVRWLKVVSGSAEGAARTITLACRPVA